MKKIGSILLSIAALSLLGAIFSAGRDADTAGGRLVGALIVGSIGAVFMCVGNEGDKGEEMNELNQRTASDTSETTHEETYWHMYSRLNPTKANSIETLTGRVMTYQSDKDAKELVSSMERWARNLGCDIQNIKTEYLKTFKSTFDNEDTKEILEHLKKVKCKEEANYFHISTQNTCTHFMIQWLTEDLQEQSTINNANAKTNKIQCRNKKSARDLIISENAELQFVENPNTGKIFFVCGNKKGYVSPAAVEKMETGTIDDFYYAEVSVGGSDYVPCLMVANNPNHKIVKEYSIRNMQSHDSSDLEGKIRTKLKSAFEGIITDMKKNEAYINEIQPFKNLILEAAIFHFYQQMKNDKSLIAMSNLYHLDHNDILEEEYSKIKENLKRDFVNEINNDKEIDNKDDDDLPF